MSEDDKELFTLRMKKATRELHAVSDAMVNAKLAFALSDNSVWADGLLVFYEIFKFLENAMDEMASENLGRLHVKGMERTEAFEQDLVNYLGPDWKKTYIIRENVAKYLSHLNNLLENDPDLLMAYVYHLYMGLLSGGQILKKKRSLEKKLLFGRSSTNSEAVTDFGELQISDLKRQLRGAMNDVASELSENQKLALIEESKKVFKLNNSVIRTVKGTTQVLLQKLLSWVLFMIVLLVIYFYVF